MSKITNIDNKRAGRILALERKARRLTVDQLATFIGCDHSTITNYEKAYRPIPPNKVEALAKALGLDDPALIDPRAA